MSKKTRRRGKRVMVRECRDRQISMIFLCKGRKKEVLLPKMNSLKK
jgi:hypothetical protein